MTFNLNGWFTLTGAAAWIALAICAAAIILIVSNPQILSWLLAQCFGH